MKAVGTKQRWYTTYTRTTETAEGLHLLKDVIVFEDGLRLVPDTKELAEP